MSLSSTSFEARRAALVDSDKATDAQLEAFTAAKRREIDAAKRDADASKQRARAEIEALESQIDTDIAAAVVAAITPLAKRFPDAPRSTSAELGPKWRALDERARHELNDELASWHLVAAFAAAAGLADRALNVQDSRTMAIRDAGDKAAKLMVAGAADAVVDDALRALELAIGQHAPAAYASPEHGTLLRTHATSRRVRMAFETFAKEKSEREEHERREENARRLAERDAQRAAERAKRFGRSESA